MLRFALLRLLRHGWKSPHAPTALKNSFHKYIVYGLVERLWESWIQSVACVCVCVCVCVCECECVCVCGVCVHCVCVCCHKRLLESTEWVSMYICGVRLYGKLQLYTRAPYVCAFEYSDTVNWCMVVWCTQKLCRNGSSFTLHQPFKGSVKAVSGHKITPNRFKTTYRSVLTFEEKKQSITYLFKTFSGLD